MTLVCQGIGNIPSTTTTTTLYTIFSPYGPIESVRVLTHKNCGFVNFETLEDAQYARRSLHGKDIIGAGTGPLRIGFAKVPSKTGNISTMDTHDDTDLDLTKGWTPSSQKEDYQTQMLMYMMAEMMGDASANIFTAVAAERKQIMEELGEDDSDGPLFDRTYSTRFYKDHDMLMSIFRNAYTLDLLFPDTGCAGAWPKPKGGYFTPSRYTQTAWYWRIRGDHRARNYRDRMPRWNCGAMQR